ncbi:nickel-responsive regulator 1 [Candidatus Woesearchaeota archaeon]|nr:nickel-responsive regulator 1 [Candidatus Woesearchaeota archaeon]|tara:strand:- start:22365 stop:22748 length:384 start_codon:yes stop_codon:yes gene_type:complete
MAIISISLNDKILKDIDALKSEQGFAGRSEVIRAAVRSLISQIRDKSKLVGKIDGVLLVMHDDIHSEEATKIRHKYERIIKTHIHNQLENHKCLEIFVVSGDAEKVRALADTFETSKKIGFTKLIVS